MKGMFKHLQMILIMSLMSLIVLNNQRDTCLHRLNVKPSEDRSESSQRKSEKLRLFVIVTKMSPDNDSEDSDFIGKDTDKDPQHNNQG